MTRKARIGSISSGTLLTTDLIETFSAELEYLAGPSNLTREAEAWLATDEDLRDDDEGDGILCDLANALDELAPPFCIFGTLEGDGADYGFWPCWDAINDLPRITDDATCPHCGEPMSFEAQAKALGEDCAYVNDHGNVTIYGADGSILLELV